MAALSPEGEKRPFRRVGPERLASPVILSVPHAGRHYSDALLAAARVPADKLMALEDRLVDRLIWRALAGGTTALIADAPRAEIDLNRHEREMDPLSLAPPVPRHAFIQSARTRGGLGLVPSTLPSVGAIWRHRLSGVELLRRVEAIHRPFHATLSDLLDEAHETFGVAVLLDCHSMPPRRGRRDEAQIVIGDRHGTSTDPLYREVAHDVAVQAGFRVALNNPYAGGHITATHGRPREGVHALQLELDRSLYLDEALKEPGADFDRIARLIAAMAAALGDAAMNASHALAAE